MTIDRLRAIPWVFSWNQSRHGVPGWYGLGSALEELIASDGLEATRRLYSEWPFFRALIDNAQLALARADMDVAACYAELAEPGVRELFRLIREEHARTLRRLLEVVNRPELLGDWPTIARTVRRRNPFVDVLSHLQVELLRRLRAASPEDAERIRQVLLVTINGIAAGLQTAG